MFNKLNYKLFVIMTLGIFFLLPVNTGFSQIETTPISAISFLGINLGVTRDMVIDDTIGNFVPEAARLLEMDESTSFGTIGEIDKTIIKAKAIPFIEQIYFQFLEDPRNGEIRLYEILIHFNDKYVGYFELLDLLSEGLEIENPEFDPSSEESDSNKRLIKYKSYGTPAVVESEKVVWGLEEESKVKIILTRSNTINQFGNVVRFIHKDGFNLVKAINNPKSKIDMSSIEFNELTESTTNEQLYTPNIIGRKLYFLSALLPQELYEEDSDD